MKPHKQDMRTEALLPSCVFRLWPSGILPLHMEVLLLTKNKKILTGTDQKPLSPPSCFIQWPTRHLQAGYKGSGPLPTMAAALPPPSLSSLTWEQSIGLISKCLQWLRINDSQPYSTTQVGWKKKKRREEPPSAFITLEERCHQIAVKCLS